MLARLTVGVVAPSELSVRPIESPAEFPPGRLKTAVAVPIESNQLVPEPDSVTPDNCSCSAIDRFCGLEAVSLRTLVCRCSITIDAEPAETV